jgi:hypothetical protein
VRTTQLTGGYLRPNGVPFSERATMKEFFITFTLPGDAGTWLIVTMVVADPARRELAVQEGSEPRRVEPAALRYRTAARPGADARKPVCGGGV